jgi:hypothetical protein
LENCCTKPAPVRIVKEVERDFSIWQPVIAGICTEEEVMLADAHRLAVLNEVAAMKLKLMRGED